MYSKVTAFISRPSSSSLTFCEVSLILANHVHCVRQSHPLVGRLMFSGALAPVNFVCQAEFPKK